jgi:methionyl-tRNA formyltransferase
MSGSPLRVAVVGEEAAGVQVLHALSELRPAVEIAAVLTGGSDRTVVREAAARLGLRTSDARLVRSAAFAEQLDGTGIDLLLNVHSLHIVHPDVVEAPTIGSFNLHPGPLPQYAGLNVPSWAIYHGEHEHAVTVHWMDAGVDSGPIAWSSAFNLTDQDTGLSVSAKCVREGVPLAVKLVEVALADPTRIPRIEQDRSRRRYFHAGPPNDGRLDWHARALEVIRFIRAADYAPFISPWGHPTAKLGGREVGIAKAVPSAARSERTPGTIRDISDDGAVVSTLDEDVIVQRLWIDGSYRRPADVLCD